MKVEFFSRDYPGLVREFERLMGAAEVDRKFKKIDHALRRANPFVAAYYGVPPGVALWLGFRKALQALKRHDDVRIGEADVRRAIDLAATVHVLWPTMPEWKRNELKSRLLSDNAVEPILLELKTALDLVLSDHKVTWIAPSEIPGVRTPDLLCEKDCFAFEVECKAESVDKGRKVARAAMHDFCYRLATALLREKIKGLWRDVSVRVPDHFLASHIWQEDLVQKIAGIKGGGDVCLADGTYAKVVLRLATDHVPPLEPGSFGHLCLLAERPDGGQPALTIRCRSTKPDVMLNAIQEDLKDALGQLSGDRPGRIVCYVPEVPSFWGLNTLDSGIAQMTYYFFKKHQRARTVFAVDYVSDIDLHGGAGLARGLHFLSFCNLIRNLNRFSRIPSSICPNNNHCNEAQVGISPRNRVAEPIASGRSLRLMRHESTRKV